MTAHTDKSTQEHLHTYKLWNILVALNPSCQTNLIVNISYLNTIYRKQNKNNTITEMQFLKYCKKVSQGCEMSQQRLVFIFPNVIQQASCQLVP